MSDKIFINKLLEKGSVYILRVKKIDNSIGIYTLMNRYGVIQPDNNEYISLYNLITEKKDDIKITDIESYSISNQNIVENVKSEYGYIQYCKKIFSKCKNKKIPIKNFYKNFMNSFAIDMGVQHAVCDLNFLLDENMIRGENIPNESMQGIKNSFYDLVDEKIKENVNELLQLKEECETEEDIEDIDEIITMFKFCKEEICFENVKNIKDILNEWPPLLLPLPNALDKLLDLKIPEEEDKTQFEQFTDLIKTIDAEILFDFIKILEDNKENLDLTVYNEYKSALDTEYYKKFDEKL
tara:strand:- start:769 stop:1656 length:888 start_codon:yes stop_codon:yes gene_type:complete